MSAYSTLYISQNTGRKYLLNKVYSLDDNDLSRILDILLEDRLYNVQIICNSECKDDDILNN